jgi:hypothetical protein
MELSLDGCWVSSLNPTYKIGDRTTEIQEAIENRNVTNIRTKLSVIEPAPLMAATEEELSPFTVRPFFDTAIGHSGMPDNVKSVTKTRSIKIATSEVSIGQISAFKAPNFSLNENSADRSYMSQVGSSQISTDQIGITQVSGEQISIPQNRFNQTSLTQISSEQIGSSQISPTEIDLFKISPTQIDAPQVSSFKSSDQSTNSVSFTHFSDDSQQFNPSEIPFSSIVPSQQFISSDLPNHNSTPEIINVLNNSATKIWSDLLQSPTQLDIDFQITDLPSGQLAEATITGFDDSGKPNAGTILIDRIPLYLLSISDRID